MVAAQHERVDAAVIGGGIAGLAAAWFLAQRHDVTVFEAADRVGGKLRREHVAAVAVDVGAEAMLNRRPEGVELARAVGLDLVHPTDATSRLYSRGALRPLPRSLMGIPLDLDALAASGVLSDAGLAAVRAEADRPGERLPDDESVGDLLARRFGPELVDRLAEPLLGGVYAGHARALSTRAALPQAEALLARGSLLAGVADLPANDAPVFAGLAGGMGRLPEALAASGRFTVTTGRTVVGLDRDADGFVLTLAEGPRRRRLHAERVVLATPAPASARLLATLAPGAAGRLAAMQAASVAVATFAFRLADLPADLAEGCSGFLVPPVERSAIKASTFSFGKWAWVREAGRGAGPRGEDLAFVRTSLGRHGDVATLQRPDAELVAVSLADLARLAGLRATPLAHHVQRWGGGLPQYPVGHLDTVAAIRAEVAGIPGLAVCGAAYDGVGIPAVVGSARRATMEP